MATRLYLPASGTPPLASLAVNSNWELTNSLARRPCYTVKQNTALATDTRLWPASSTQQWCWLQYQSRPLAAAYNWTTSDTVSMVIGKCAETTLGGDTHLAYVVRVVSANGSVVRGVIGLFHATSTEYPLVASAATRIHDARTNGATNFSSQVGDIIVIEIGLHGVTPAAENIQMRFGDPTGTADFALTAALITDLDPWVELSRTVVFGFADARTEAASAADAPSVVMTAPVARIEAASATETQDAGLLFQVAISESAGAGDSQNAGIATPASIGEAASASESPSATLTTPAGVTDAASATETSDATISSGGTVYNVSISEPASALDVQDGAIAGLLPPPQVIQHIYHTVPNRREDSVTIEEILGQSADVRARLEREDEEILVL